MLFKKSIAGYFTRNQSFSLMTRALRTQISWVKVFRQNHRNIQRHNLWGH